MSRPISRLARACSLALLAALVAAAPAQATFALGKLRSGSGTGAEDYAFASGDAVFPDGTVDAKKWHRFAITDSAGVVQAQSARSWRSSCPARTPRTRSRSRSGCAAIEALPDHPHVTVSAGVATYPLGASDAAALLVAADRAIYASKAAGRNRVTAAERSAFAA